MGIVNFRGGRWMGSELSRHSLHLRPSPSSLFVCRPSAHDGRRGAATGSSSGALSSSAASPSLPAGVTPELWALRTLFRWAVAEAMCTPDPMAYLLGLLPPVRAPLMNVLAKVASR